MNDDNRNLILAILLSIGVIFVWQHFIAGPQVDKQRQQQAQTSQAQPPVPGQPASSAPQPSTATPQSAPAVPGAGAPAGAAVVDRNAALAASPRVPLQTARLSGSINLRGGRIDDLSLRGYHETIDPKSANIVLLAPSGTQHPLYVELGWVAGSATKVAVPGPTTEWTPDSREPLTDARPLVLTWDNGQGLVFRRTITLDARYMFTVADEVENRGAEPVTLFNYGLVSRHGTPEVAGYYILHEGLIGVIGDNGLQEFTYSKAPDEPKIWKGAKGGWLGFTDKYWAATVIPDQKAPYQARFSTGKLGELKTYQTDFLSEPITLAAGGKVSTSTGLFAGAKEVSIVDGYEKSLGIRQLDLLIDWGWFYFITKPLFWVIDYLFKLVGNFGVAILLVTVAIKGIFFPLASKSYASMAKMKALQPQMVQLRERYGDDKMRQQQAMMELYKREKVNPLAGCWPVVIQIPVFFALYKVLFVTIEMRHTPFYGWIHDLAAPDPTNIFNLFGLIPWAPPAILPVLGAWPLIMGVSMWIQMKMNPAPPDATQKMIFDWMPLVFTFMLASFPAGLVIYWTWNNFLSVLQQYFIMRKHGVKVELWDNLRVKKKTPAG